MGQRRMWWIGLAPLLALWLGVNKFEIEPLEADLAGRADAALAQVTGEPGFSVAAAGRDVSLKGWIFDESLRPAALAVVAVPGVRRVEDALSEPPPANPFLWRAVLEGGVLTISGAASSPRDRAAIVAAAQKALPQARIVDQMSYFSGAPAAFLASAEGGLQVLAHLNAGEAQILGDDLNLSGQAATPADYQSAVAQAQNLPSAKLAIKTPNESTFGFVAENDDKTVVLSGDIGSNEDRAALLAQAKTLFADRTVVDRLEVVAGAPARSADQTGQALRALAFLKSGKASLRDNVTTLDGQARPGMDAMSVAAAVAGTPGTTLDLKGVSPGEAVEATAAQAPAAQAPAAQAPAAQAPAAQAPAAPPEARPVEAKDCLRKMMDLIRATPIRFEYGEAEIRPESAVVLDALAAVARQCPASAFNVTGHWRNLDLSLRRAETIVAHLVAAGVDRARLTAVGGGEGMPPSPEDGSTKRRGVEFNLK